MIIEKKTDTYTLRLDLDLNYKVWKTKKTKLTKVDLPNHFLVGRRIFDHHKQRELNIQSVHKHWYGGWYLVLLVEHDGSHGLVLYENISCFHPIILEQIEEAQYQYSLLD